MKCSNCGNEMVQSRAGWLCVECGHIELNAEANPDQHLASLPKIVHERARVRANEPIQIVQNGQVLQVVQVTQPAGRVHGSKAPAPTPAASMPEQPPAPEMTESVQPEPAAEEPPAPAAASVQAPAENMPTETIAEIEQRTRGAVTSDQRAVTEEPPKPENPVESESAAAPEEASVELTSALAMAVANQPEATAVTEAAPESQPASQPEPVAELESEEPKPKNKKPAPRPKRRSEAVLEPQTAISSSPAVAAAIENLPPIPELPDRDIEEDYADEPVAAPVEPEKTPESAPMAEPKPAPEPVTEAAKEPESIKEPESTKEPEPAKEPEPKPVAQDLKPAKPPLQPHTHPRPMSKRRKRTITATFIAICLAAGAAAYYIGVTGKDIRSFLPFLAPAVHTNLPTATPAATASPSPTPSPTPSPSPTPDPAAADAQRKADLAKLAAAYKADAAATGYFSTPIPSNISIDAKDPTTGQPYVISTSVPTAAGQIRYWAGGSCAGMPHTPGTGGTKYLALQTWLESTSSVYCLDVQ